MNKLYTMFQITSRIFLIIILWISCMASGTDANNGLNHMKTTAMPGTPLLVTDAKSEKTLPNKLRVIPNYHGIAGIVGSAQFNETGLEAIITRIQAHHPKKKLWLVDLRQETHFFANGQSLSFYGQHNSDNFHKTPAQIHQEESDIITAFQKKSEPTTVNVVLEKANGDISKTQPILFNLQASQSEETLAKQHGLNYKRFYITDHQAPTQAVQLKLVEFINQLDSNDWVIVHCRGGKGRTTTFMLLTALLKDKQNNKLNNLESYIQEQIDFDGSNLFKTDNEDDPIWQQEHKKNRIKFIHHFYENFP